MDITGNIPGWCSYKIPYAIAERTVIKEGTIVSQFHSHVLYFMEVMELNLQEDLQATYLVKEASLFLFMVLGGRIDFSTPEGEPIATAPSGICYATYNKPCEYIYRLSAGIHRLCYLCPMPIWVQKNIKRYPRLRPFMEEMLGSDRLFGHLPACRMDARIWENLLRLFEHDDTKGEDLESTQSKVAKELIDAYQSMLNIKFGHRAYRIRVYLDENYADASLSNQALIKIFNTTEKTLVRDFRMEFSITPHAYLMQLRMYKAKTLLDSGIHVNMVYPQVGYADLRSFGKQFKNFFGFPPSGYR